jgi:hypothetical protein
MSLVYTNCKNCGQTVYNNNGYDEEFCCNKCYSEWYQEYVNSGQAAADQEAARIQAIEMLRFERKRRFFGFFRIVYFLPPYLIFCWFWSMLYSAYYPIAHWQMSNWLMFFVCTCLALVFAYRADDRGDSSSGYIRQWFQDFFGFLIIGLIPLCMIGMRLNWNLVLKIIMGFGVLMFIPIRLVKELAATIVVASLASITTLFASKWLAKFLDSFF